MFYLLTCILKFLQLGYHFQLDVCVLYSSLSVALGRFHRQVKDKVFKVTWLLCPQPAPCISLPASGTSFYSLPKRLKHLCPPVLPQHGCHLSLPSLGHLFFIPMVAVRERPPSPTTQEPAISLFGPLLPDHCSWPPVCHFYTKSHNTQNHSVATSCSWQYLSPHCNPGYLLVLCFFLRNWLWYPSDFMISLTYTSMYALS